MNLDISDLLKEVPYDPDNESNNYRLIHGKDGKDKVIIRPGDTVWVQIEADGRPDGKKPHGMESLLNFYLKQVDEHVQKHGNSKDFSLDIEECRDIREEYEWIQRRYCAFLILKEFERAARDTDHNLKLRDLIHGYADNDTSKLYFATVLPGLIGDDAWANIELHKQNRQYGPALKCAVNTKKKLISLPVPCLSMHFGIIPAPQFEVYRKNSIDILDAYIKELKDLTDGKIPKDMKKEDEIERLRQKLKNAVKKDEFEIAAKLRDKIQAMGGDSRI